MACRVHLHASMKFRAASILSLVIAPSFQFLNGDPMRPQLPAIGQICDRLVKADDWRFSALQNYTVTRRYSLSSSRRQSAEMAVRMEYSYPDRKSFEILWQKGSNAVHTRVFRKLIEAEIQAAQEEMRDETRITPKNYDFRLVGTAVQNGRNCYVLELNPKTRSKYLIEGRVWVDVQDFAITRIEGSPAGRVSLWIRSMHMVQQYRKIGPFWLPASNHTVTDVRIFGPAELSIDYADYQINTRPENQAAVNGPARRLF